MFRTALSWTNLDRRISATEHTSLPETAALRSTSKGGHLVSPVFAAVDIGNSLQQGLNAFFAFVPRLVGFLLVLLIGYVVARVVKGILTKVLGRVGIDRALHSGSHGQYVNKVAPDLRPSTLIGTL